MGLDANRRQYAESFSTAERAQAAETIREWLRLDTWTVREGLFLLVGIDPARSENLVFNDSGVKISGVGAALTWCRITKRPGVEFDGAGNPHVVGYLFEPYAITELSTVLRLWASNPEHTMRDRRTPSYFIEWALRKGCAPFWLNWVPGLETSAAPAAAAATQAPEPQEKHTLKSGQQDERILSELRLMGYDPVRLPPREPGKPGVKAAVWSKVRADRALFTESSFRKAWERLRASGAVTGGE